MQPPVRRLLVALLAGLGTGILISWSGSTVLQQLPRVLEPVGTLWLNGIRMTVVPLVMSLLFAGIVAPDESGGLARLGVRTLVVFLALVSAAAIYAALVVPVIVATLPAGATASLAAPLRASAAAGATQTMQAVEHLPSFAQWLTMLVPVNPFAAAADGAMLPLIVFTLAFALAARHVRTAGRQALLVFFRTLSDAMLVLVRWLVAVAPIGIFALIVPPAARLGVTLAGELGLYILTITVALLGLTMLLYPIAAIAGRVAPRAFARAVLPAQAVALGSSSSMAALPALVEGARDRLTLPARVSGFVLPLAVAAFKIATPVTWCTGTLFLARLYGVPVGVSALATLVAGSMLLSFSIPGVPQGAFLLLAPLLATVGVPPEGVGLLLAADTIPDLIGTLANVTGDMTAAVIVA